MLKSITLQSSIERNVTIDTYPLNNEFLLFECKVDSIRNGEIEREVITSGVQSIKAIESAIENVEPLTPNNTFIFMDDEMRSALRNFGFPNHNERETVTYGKNKETAQPYSIFVSLMEERLVTIQKIKENPELINDIAKFDYSNYRVNMAISNEMVNTALFSSWLNFSSSHFDLFYDLAHKLFEDGRISTELNRKKELLTWYNEIGYELNGRIILTDAEFASLVKRDQEIRKEKKLVDAYDYPFSQLAQAFLEVDPFGISDSHYGYKTNNAYQSKASDFE